MNPRALLKTTASAFRDAGIPDPEVDAALRVRGARLLVAHGDPVEAIPRLAKAIGATSVWTNKDYEPSAVARDNAVAAKLKAAGAEGIIEIPLNKIIE